MIYGSNNLRTQSIMARNLEEARGQLFQLYGKNYEIINTQSVPKVGFLGLFPREELKVTYTVKNLNVAIEKNEAENFQAAKIDEEQSKKSLELIKGLMSSDGDFLKNRDELVKKTGGVPINAEVSKQLKDLQTTVQELSENVKNTSKALENHPTIMHIQEILQENDFSFSYINEICAKVRKTFSLDELDDVDLVEKQVLDWIGENIEIAPEKVYRRPHIIVLVGPTGIGKTTTLMKFVVKNVAEAKTQGHQIDFHIITTDTMRVGALEQINRYAELCGKEAEKAETNDDFEMLYNRYKDTADVIFIDTAGYSQNDARHIAELKNILTVQGMNADIYLALSASTKAVDLQKIIQNYEPFGYQSVIVTKCDESEYIGNILSVLKDKHKAVSFLTTGQKTSNETLVKATPLEFLNRLQGFKKDMVHLENKFTRSM